MIRTTLASSLALFVVAGAVGGLGLTGCKGETKVRENPETAKKLSACETNLVAKEDYIKTLEARITELESGEGQEVVVKIDGEAMEITAGADRGPHASTRVARGNAKDAELYKGFVASLKKSRGAIQKCYQSALKKNTAIQARTITLDISVNYKTSGKVAGTRFNPRVSEQFDSCMRSVAEKWTLPAMPRGVSFAYKQTLTPE